MTEPARKSHGGARANSGGYREGSGRKPTGNAAVRRVTVSLDQELSDLLATVEADGMEAPDAIRWCVRHAVEHVEANADGLVHGTAPKIARVAKAEATKRKRGR